MPAWCGLPAVYLSGDRVKTLPALEPHCGSWIILRDGRALGETFDRHTAQQCLDYGYSIETAAQYLARINREGKQ